MNQDDLIKEFLEKGGVIEILPTIEPKLNRSIGSFSKKIPELKTLDEAELLYGKKQDKKKVEKIPDLSGIDMSFIPEHLKKLLVIGSDKDINKGDTENEAN